MGLLPLRRLPPLLRAMDGMYRRTVSQRCTNLVHSRRTLLLRPRN